MLFNFHNSLSSSSVFTRFSLVIIRTPIHTLRYRALLVSTAVSQAWVQFQLQHENSFHTTKSKLQCFMQQHYIRRPPIQAKNYELIMDQYNIITIPDEYQQKTFFGKMFHIQHTYSVLQIPHFIVNNLAEFLTTPVSKSHLNYIFGLMTRQVTD